MWMVAEDAVGARPESRFHLSSLTCEADWERNRGCSSLGGAADGGGRTMTGEPVVVVAVVVEAAVVVTAERGRAIRRGFLGGGSRIGGSACLVCSYRRETRALSSRKDGIRVGGLDLGLTLANFFEAIFAI